MSLHKRAGLRVQLFDLAGKAVLDAEASGRVLRAPTPAGLANGVYLYIVTVRGYDGSILRSKVQKLVILR